jgi:aminopeptidase C
VDEKSGLEYWQYANTWGHDFGEHGFFRVAITNLPEEVAAGNI